MTSSNEPQKIYVPEGADVETVHSIMNNIHKMAQGRRNT